MHPHGAHTHAHANTHAHTRKHAHACTHAETCAWATAHAQLHAYILIWMHAAGRDHVPVPCTVEDGLPGRATPPPPPSPSASAATAALLRSAFRSSLDRQGPACLTQLLTSSCTLHMRTDGTACLQGAMLTPGAPLSLTPLYAKRMCDTPLSQQLLAPSGSAAAGQLGALGSNGLLTMDQARSVLPLAADDPNVSRVRARVLVGCESRARARSYGCRSPHAALQLRACAHGARMYACACCGRASKPA